HFPNLIVPVFVLLVAVVLAGCSQPAPTPTSTPTPAPTATPTAAPTQTPTAVPEPTPTPEPALRVPDKVPGIVDPTNLGWPREVEGLNGVVSIPAKPERVIAASVGHDEVILALVPGDRLVAVGGPTKDETFSNVASLVQDKPEVTRDPETIIARSPDVIVTSPFFPTEGVEALSRLGIPVVQTALQHDPEARIENILLIGYILGEEERALEFADEVRERYDAVVAATAGAGPRPRVLALTQYSDQVWVAGGNSTEGGVITAAGGINAAEEAGVDGNQTTSLEGVIAMDPEVIIIPQPAAFGAEDFRQSLLANETLAEVPAISSGAVHVVESKHFTTLSYWNILGAEDLVRLLWGDDFAQLSATPFSLPE
ncbi:MAG: ABC transporter substrate-binding protein, partial [Chloroflexi bacterium]|nr:ABC transporter substrate-binding protein [Chloroflexota bacterium]